MKRRVMRERVLPIGLAAALVVLASWYFLHTGQSLRDDRWLALGCVAGWALIWLQTLLGTPRPRPLDLGLMVTFVGLVLFFGRFVIALWGWHDPGSWMDAAYRGAFVVGLLFLIPASLQWFWVWLSPRRGQA